MIDFPTPTKSAQPPKVATPRNGSQNGAQPSSGSPPPNSFEAEQSTLGAMMLDRAAIAHAQSTLTARDFHREIHRKIFAAICELAAADKPVDLITLTEELRRRGQLEEVSGVAYLTALSEACPSAANVPAYTSVVREMSQRRTLAAASDELHALAYALDSTEAQRATAASVLMSIIEKSATATKPRFSFRSLAEVEEQPARAMRIQNVLPSDCLAALVGPYAGFKSFQALDMGLSIATGSDWQGLKVEQAPVVYIAAEGAGEIGKRTRAWRIRHRCDRPANFHFLTEAVHLMNEGEVAALAREIAQFPEAPGLIVIDTLARNMAGGDENATKDMGLIVDAADALRRATGATILIIHHTGKDGTLRGNTALPGAMDTIIEVKAKESHVTLCCTKQKDLAPFMPFSLVKRVVELDESGATSLVFDIAAAGDIPTAPETISKAEATRTRILLILKRDFSDGTKRGQLQKACEKFVGKSSFYDHLRALEEEGKTRLNDSGLVEIMDLSDLSDLSDSDILETG
jgi:hypothetical protein